MTASDADCAGCHGDPHAPEERLTGPNAPFSVPADCSVCGGRNPDAHRDRAYDLYADELADRHEADARRDDELADLRAELERHGR